MQLIGPYPQRFRFWTSEVEPKNVPFMQIPRAQGTHWELCTWVPPRLTLLVPYAPLHTPSCTSTTDIPCSGSNLIWRFCSIKATCSYYLIIRAPLTDGRRFRLAPSQHHLSLCYPKFPQSRQSRWTRGVSNHHPNSKLFLKCLPLHQPCQGLLNPRSYQISRGETLKAAYNLGLLYPFPACTSLLHFQKQLALSYCRYQSLGQPSQGDSHSYIMYWVSPSLRADWVASSSKRARQLHTSTCVWGWGVAARTWQTFETLGHSLGHGQSEKTGPHWGSRSILTSKVAECT